ncbi:hypothetical protein ENSA5_02570 [Enhygromyxa salina]|uniref:Uncharacterized protein n=1 Tax=Enhygromyxa salina TaxID=215803 RepID=A0A2S9YK07_9BACT|nr:STAS/SEC14 domain-containing protein [Enhygromyxa salina]PRQ05437.1 hypothetical protein ENSA5_02570 [Enhygromyxa salina]
MIRLHAKNWTVRGDLMVCFFLPGPLTTEVWQDCCDTIASPEVTKLLVASIGAVEIDANQRRQINEALRTPPTTATAVVTDEAIVRGLMTATAWLGRIDIKAFPWHKLAEAVDHLAPVGLSVAEALDLVDLVRHRAEDDEDR